MTLTKEQMEKARLRKIMQRCRPIAGIMELFAPERLAKIPVGEALHIRLSQWPKS